MTVYTDPALYGPGKSGPQILWLRQRLDAHGIPLEDCWGHSDQCRVKAFQEAQGWTGDDADGIPGPVTLLRLAANP